MKDLFVNLHSHSAQGSLADSMVTVDQLFNRVKELGQEAIALTDHGTMASVFDARKASKKTGVKYIPGCEIYFVNDVSDKKGKRYHLVLLAKNETGYRNLLKLNYLGFKSAHYVPVINKIFSVVDWNMLEEYHNGIICLTACSSGPIARALLAIKDNNPINEVENYSNALEITKRLQKIFGEDLYLEIQPHDLKAYSRDRKTGDALLDASGNPIVSVDQPYINKKIIQISKELNIPLTATCDVHYLNKEDAKAHDMLMAINEKKPLNDKNRHRYEVEEFYLKSSSEILNYFTSRFDENIALEVCNNSIIIANKCEDSKYIDSDKIRFPIFDASKEKDYDKFLSWNKNQSNKTLSEDKAYMRFKCINAFGKMYRHLSEDDRKIYKERLTEEIKVFEEKNFCSYMLITSDFINKAKEHGVRIGPGRGSVGGSLVGNLLGIHELDPIQYGLLFERFINREKVAFPDIDTDFSPDGREWVEQYVIKKYGELNVAHVSNFSKITPKVVLKDIARSLEIGGGKSEAFKIANDITDSISIDSKTFDNALQESASLRKICVEYPDIEKYGRKLVGLEKTFATHAAGIVISDIDLSTYIPLRYDKDGILATQYEKERCEKVGLIKMDFLGLEHLKIIDGVIANSKKLGLDCPDTVDLAPFDDKGVWDMISRGKTSCVFQMGSTHMQAMCKRIRPRNIEDLSLVNALGRPSAAKSRDLYIARRDGNKKVSYKYDFLEKAFKETLGICVYEEQLLKLARYAAGWSLNKADGLRKLTKLKGKDPKMAAQLEGDFINDTVANSGLTNEQAKEIWKDIIEPFAGYGFNKAHGIFYSLNGYHTAYYKHHYPAPFMAAVLKSEVEKTSSNAEKMKEYKQEAQRMGIKIIAPDINFSEHSFSVRDQKTIVMGFGTVKGVGDKAIENILEVRSVGPFTSFADFLHRTNSRVVQKKVIQSLAQAGCFDSLGVSRRGAFLYYAEIRTKTAKHIEKLADKNNVLDVLKNLKIENTISDFHDEWNKKEILNGEMLSLGEYLSGGINDIYNEFFTNQGTALSRIKNMADGASVRIEVVVDGISEQKTKTGKSKGQSYGNCSIVDKNGDASTMKIWSNVWNKVRDEIKVGRPIRAVCKINSYNGNNTLVLNSLEKVG